MNKREFNFYIKKAPIYRAIRWEKYFPVDLLLFLRKTFAFSFLFTLFLFLFLPLGEIINMGALSALLGLAIIFLTLFSVVAILQGFFNRKLKNPANTVALDEVLDYPHHFNLVEFLDFETAKAVSRSIQYAQSKRIGTINSLILLYFILEDNPKLNFIFYRANLDLGKIKKSAFRILKDLEAKKKKTKKGGTTRGRKAPKDRFSKAFQDIIFNSFQVASEKGKTKVGLGDILISFSCQHPFFQKILIEEDLRDEDIENLVWWLESLERKIAEAKEWWEYKNLMRRNTLARQWTAGYTLTLDKYSIDWTEVIKKRNFEEIIGHWQELKTVERILDRQEINNVLLVGEPGVGKKSIVHALAIKSFFGTSLKSINHKRVIELDIVSLIAQLDNKDEVELVLDQIFQEVLTAGNIILVIDEFHNYVGGAARPGIVDISGVLARYLRLPQFQIVSITSYVGLHKYIELNPSMRSFFEKVEVSELSPKETVMVLENLVPSWERKYKRSITYPAIKKTVSYSVRYIQNIPLPKKAVDLMDEVMVYAARYTKSKMVVPKHVAKIVSEKTQIPVGEVEIKEREMLLNLEELIHQRIINQNEAVKEISSSLRRARTEVSVRKGPMGTFLFLGPTGVGKTETAKSLTEIYFGSESRIIRLDMSEFQSIQDIPRLIGAVGQEGLLTTQVRENPFSLILLDEIEKANPNILNLFLQVLDEGHITDGLGRKVSFVDTIIIATSNAGYKIILETIKKKLKFSKIKKQLLDYLFAQGIFRPEFLNRFDSIVLFQPLSEDNLIDIAQLMLNKIRKNLEEKNIELVITEAMKKKVVKMGYNPLFGARDLKRAIQDNIENVLAEALLSGKLIRGQRAILEPSPEGFKLTTESRL